MAWIFYLSQQSAPLGVSPNEFESKAAHVALYAVLALLFSWAMSSSNGAPAWLVAGLSFALAVLYGASDEVHQAFVVGRTASNVDLAFDGVGAFVGVMLALGVPLAWKALGRRKTKETP